ncbi:MAG TPA: hypothetical protein IAA98_13705 [Candidatus Avipropionibacterium avicola]|uniref:Signal transduction histidine kinase n=1 Tax=Candidatus Avipropionibacterium avicola TaxID=2840701 RepID=A0A9D1H087_9ACTN|nr:hypothetical protein [Candidatus Avipropionibacterium avicola]
MIDLHIPLFRAHAVLRVVLVLVTVGINLTRTADAARPALLWAVTAAMVAVTVATALLYPYERRRRLAVFVADVVLTVAMVLTTPYVFGGLTTGGVTESVVGFWAVTAPLAVALWRGWLMSGIATAAVAGAGLVIADRIDIQTIAESIVVVLTCVSVGWFTSQLRTTTRDREQMHGIAAAMTERQRLSRIVHDGVLQVLAMVEREGRALGPRGLRLARAAHEQEVQLRQLLQDTDIELGSLPGVLADVTHLDLSAVLDKHAAHGVSIATPPDTVLVESHRAGEINAAVAEALSNVHRHAGPDAEAWVLLEVDGDELIISIRDNGVGGTRADFEAASERGRMGMRHSIHGRLADLGGTAVLRTEPGEGTEWEFRIPVEA